MRFLNISHIDKALLLDFWIDNKKLLRRFAKEFKIASPALDALTEERLLQSNASTLRAACSDGRQASPAKLFSRFTFETMTNQSVIRAHLSSQCLIDRHCF